MPLIQIEQDNPELIALVNSHIEDMVARMRKHPGTVIVAAAEEYVHGYLAALFQQSLLSDEQWRRLHDMALAAAKAS